MTSLNMDDDLMEQTIMLRREDSNSDMDCVSDINCKWSDESILNKPSQCTNEPALSGLPEEVLYYIFAFLSVTDLVQSVKEVCKTFNQMLTDNYFKRRMKKFFGVGEIPKLLKAVGVGQEEGFSWMQTCYNIEEERHRWIDRFDDMENIEFSHHTSSVDVAKILDNGTLLISGGRERVICLWDVIQRPRLLSFNDKSHTGWIWDAISDHNKCFSCDWDGKIIEWSLARGLTDPVTTYKRGRPTLCLAVKDNLLISGHQTGQISVIDLRTNPDEGELISLQKSAIMDIEIMGFHVFTISEDKSISVYDLKSRQQIRKNRISNSTPVCLSRVNSAIYIAHTDGTISLINSTTFKKWQSFSTYDSRLTSIYARLGSIITSSRNGIVNIYSPGKFSSPIRQIKVKGEVASVDYCYGKLALARSDNKITLINCGTSSDGFSPTD